ncbi:MAG: fatty acid/phospholipid synthesis protein PlsX [Bacilli bacterium]|nr:fatty acid/phospholipid synthesis protein PlsX [Bacilli bacterium]
MEFTQFFKSVLDEDHSAIVICDLNHIIIYMNSAAFNKYKKRGGKLLLGKSLLDCHNSQSIELINKIIGWFQSNQSNNRIYMYHDDKENKDVYMIALRNEEGNLIGYYEKHEYRNPETQSPYQFD